MKHGYDCITSRASCFFLIFFLIFRREYVDQLERFIITVVTVVTVTTTVTVVTLLKRNVTTVGNTKISRNKIYKLLDILRKKKLINIGR